MNPLTFDQLVAVLALACTVLSLVVGGIRGTKQSAADSQVIRDKLDGMSEDVRETRDTVRNMDLKLDDHAQRLSAIEARQDAVEKRLDKLEARCERHFGDAR